MTSEVTRDNLPQKCMEMLTTLDTISRLLFANDWHGAADMLTHASQLATGIGTVREEMIKEMMEKRR